MWVVSGLDKDIFDDYMKNIIKMIKWSSQYPFQLQYK